MDYNVIDFGALGNGNTLDTAAIQKAIDCCSNNGGGNVVFKKGIYLIGTIFLKSNVTIYLEHNSVILGTSDTEYYPSVNCKQMYRNETHMDACLIYADNCENISICGEGTIDGQGNKFSNEFRPMLCRYFNCKNIRLSSIKMRRPASWTNAFIGCRDIRVDSIDIISRANANGDGVDFDGCQNVFVSNCSFDCSDDCICLQNSFTDRKCKNIVVTNNIMMSKWAGMRIGLLSCGDIENVTVSNCVFRNIDCSGLKIQSAEGATLQNMTFTNLIMENVLRPIFITLNYFRERTDTSLEINTRSYLRNMSFSNIIANNVDEDHFAGDYENPQCITIDSVKDNAIENITLSDIQYTVVGKEKFTKREDNSIPYHTNKRAEGKNYNGDLPAYGLFARNVKNMSLNNVRFSTVKPDARVDKYII